MDENDINLPLRYLLTKLVLDMEVNLPEVALPFQNMNIELNFKPLKIGIDMGGVCVYKSRIYENDDKELEGLINVKGCLDSLQKLKDDGHILYLVSYCGARRAAETREQLERLYPDLFTELFFVKAKKDKNAILKRYGMDIMIDDNIGILQSITDIPPTHVIHYIEEIPPAKLEKTRKYNGTKRTECETWEELYKILTSLTSLDRMPDKNIDVSSLLHT